MTFAEIKPLKEATFKYPEKATNEIKERDVFVINKDETDIYTISLHDVDEAKKAEIIEAGEKLNALIAEMSAAGKFRRFKKDKFAE